jgi:hypothetical protein
VQRNRLTQIAFDDFGNINGMGFVKFALMPGIQNDDQQKNREIDKKVIHFHSV